MSILLYFSKKITFCNIFQLQEKYLREDIDLNADTSKEKHRPQNQPVNANQTKTIKAPYKPDTVSHLHTQVAATNQRHLQQNNNHVAQHQQRSQPKKGANTDLAENINLYDSSTNDGSGNEENTNEEQQSPIKIIQYAKKVQERIKLQARKRLNK